MHPEKTTATNAQDLTGRLKNLPLQQPPAHLHEQIMARIRNKPASRLSRLWQQFNQPLNFSLRPAYVLSLTALVCTAFILGRVSVPSTIEQPGNNLGYNGDAVIDAQAAYLLGRGLLAAKRKDKALNLLHKAASLEPGNPEYAYWEGMGYWANNNLEQERLSYLRGLKTNPESIPLLINLGHNYLSDGNYMEALHTYQAVLAQEPDDGAALYNTGLIWRKLNRVDEEKTAWKMFLDHHRTGKFAFRALERLNNYGDFSYRPYRIGIRKVILSPQRLLDDSLSRQERSKELHAIAEILQQNRNMRLDVVVFAEHDLPLARKQALVIKDMLTTLSAGELAERIALSWLDSAEVVTPANAKSYTLPNGLLLFSTIPTSTTQEVST